MNEIGDAVSSILGEVAQEQDAKERRIKMLAANDALSSALSTLMEDVVLGLNLAMKGQLIRILAPPARGSEKEGGTDA